LMRLGRHTSQILVNTWPVQYGAHQLDHSVFRSLGFAEKWMSTTVLMLSTLFSKVYGSEWSHRAARTKWPILIYMFHDI
jgi:hypothetical protein